MRNHGTTPAAIERICDNLFCITTIYSAAVTHFNFLMTLLGLCIVLLIHPTMNIEQNLKVINFMNHGTTPTAIERICDN